MKNVRDTVFLIFVSVLLLCGGLLNGCDGTGSPGFYIASAPDNDMCVVISRAYPGSVRCDSAEDAVEQAPEGSGVLVFADGYPDEVTALSSGIYSRAREKNLRLYVEFPSMVPDLEMSPPVRAGLERAVVTSDVFGASVPPMELMYIHDCRYLPCEAGDPLLVLAHVAGFDRAVYGLEGTDTFPLLFVHPDLPILVATTSLSHCVRGRYAPAGNMQTVWSWILSWLEPEYDADPLTWTPTVRPAYTKSDELPGDAELQAVGSGIDWYNGSRMLLDESWEYVYSDSAVAWGDRVGPIPGASLPSGDGHAGMLEGFTSRIHGDGTQPVRWWRRFDCNAETAGAYALAGELFDNDAYARTSSNLTDWLCFETIMSQGERADSTHPAYGLFGWNDVTRYWRDRDGYGVYYGDDNARALLGLITAASLDTSGRWTGTIIRNILANFRTTGTLGFRRDRIDEGLLEERGWQAFFSDETVSYAPHFQAYLWACYLWAYDKTGYDPFRDRAVNAIRMTMDAYPDKWHWTNGIQQERARMILPLAWLVRVEDTPEHREWLSFMVDELRTYQDESGAIREELGTGPGRYGPPKSNADYGHGEATLIQENGDPLSDMLYTVNFAFLGLHEAAAAMNDRDIAGAEDRLADFLCRIQVKSETHPELDGAWFRAFDYKRWEHWGSNADAGWGVWSIESGWTQAWITSVLAMRQMDTSLWDLSKDIECVEIFNEHRREMIPDGTLK